ncbi:MAG: histidine--tRNA ligase [Bacteroidales bacterium]|jgi:histidyl-tRNA synthetase|nr:histidine--tRNA ligase [Bacteroidales bacterium]
MAQKPSIPKGTRDFTPLEMVRRNYIFDTIRSVFSNYGYQPIETPAMENLSSLLGKYGDEGDRLIFKVLNSGNYLDKVDDQTLNKKDQTDLTRQISEKGLRYDLTVPFARFVVQHRNEITFPFKRYQVQPVWRADRPQKGRYREFFQCDVDVIGSDSLLNEVELIQIIDDVFKRLGIKAVVKLNNRKILAGIAEVIGEAEKFGAITVAIDKLDKIGIDKVNEEMLEKGVSQRAIDMLQPILSLEGKLKQKFPKLKEILKDSPTGLKGCDEVMTVMHHLKDLNISTKFELDLTLARGLDYYTGAIIEVKSADVAIGSICGGGRYDDLTGVFGLEGVSGVGISFGADRIYDVLMEMDAFPPDFRTSTKLMFVNFGEEEVKYVLPVLDRIRKSGINAELFPDAAKMKKQLSWANNKGVPYIVMAGTEEMKNKKFMLKNMGSGEQELLSEKELISRLKDH